MTSDAKTDGFRLPVAPRKVVQAMNLTPREIDKLYVYQVADLARKRRERGTKLNLSEAQALISEAILEAARDGKSVAECMELGKQVVSEKDCMPGVRERLSLLQVEATFVDGSKLVSCHDPVAA
ncbi:urease subunit gamma [Oerskovia enterophila]